MKNKFRTTISKLKEKVYSFNNDAADQKISILKTISGISLSNHSIIIDYHHLLLFILTHPDNRDICNLAERELLRINNHLKRKNNASEKVFDDSGLPFTSITAQFSHNMLQWLNSYPACAIRLDSFNDDAVDLNSALSLTLPSILREETTAGLNNMELLNHLGIRKNNMLTFLLTEFSKLDHIPFVKDHLWDAVRSNISIRSLAKQFSKSYNRIPVRQPFFHGELLKSFDHGQLLETPLPAYELLDETQRDEVIAVIRKSMVLTIRETDTSTFMEPSTLRLYHLERGISIAIYGMTGNRQLPLQSYIGYTLFKNGFPMAYGGSWVFGSYALFGLNIFEVYRGAESGYIMCQLLRVYKQVFQLNYIEIEAYQFGKDNPEGISTGAFWFYYRYGFRPVDKSLDKLATKEFQKIKTQKGYRSGEKILLQLAESNMALHTGGRIPKKTDHITTAVRKMIAAKFKGNSILAAASCKLSFSEKTSFQTKLTADENTVLEEIAFWVKALDINDPAILSQMKELVYLKPGNPYAYNDILLGILKA